MPRKLGEFLHLSCSQHTRANLVVEESWKARSISQANEDAGIKYTIQGKETLMNKLLSVLILLLFFATHSVQADVEGKTASIEKMFAIMGIDQQMIDGFDAMLPAVDQMASQLNLSANDKEELKNIYRAWFDQDIDRESIKIQMIDLYADSFSQEEIGEVIEFYQTPIGQKFLEKSPELMKHSVQIGMEEGQAKQTLLINRLTPFIEKHRK